MGLSTHILSAWEKTPESKESLSGKTTTFTDAQIQFIVELYKSYEKERQRVKINAFMKHFREKWNRQSWLTPPPSRKAVEDMLLANGCRKPKAKALPKANYHPPVKRYFPHAQTVLDGKQVVVSLGGQQHPFVLEFSKDMAADAIGGCAVGKSETAELVKSAFQDHCQNHRKPLAALVDNGSGNAKAAIDLGAEGTLMIKAHPYRPETKGQIEGEFGLFARKVSHIKIEGNTQQQQAMNILKTIAKVYLRLRNQTPRCSVCPFTPKKLMKAKVDSIEAEQAYKTLKAQQDRKKTQSERRLKVSAEFHDLVDSIVKEHKLSGDLLVFKKYLKWIELSTIRKAEQQFAVQSRHDNFSPAKRTMAYFSAIARNMQNEKNQTRKQQAARRRYALDKMDKQKREKIKSELREQKEKNLLENQPHLKVISALQAEMALPVEFRKTINIFKNKIDQALLAILRKKQQRQKVFIEKIHENIMALSEFSMETRYQLVNQINERINTLSLKPAKVVTPFK